MQDAIFCNLLWKLRLPVADSDLFKKSRVNAYHQHPSPMAEKRGGHSRYDEKRAPLAQLDRAADFESVGREFESLRARHYASTIV